MAVAVVQPLPGIGDMIWHLPHIHAIAAHYGEAGDPGRQTALAGRSVDGRRSGGAGRASGLTSIQAGRRGAHDGLRGIVRLASELRARRFALSSCCITATRSPLRRFWPGFPTGAVTVGARSGGCSAAGRICPEMSPACNPNARATRFLEAAGIALAVLGAAILKFASPRSRKPGSVASLPRPLCRAGDWQQRTLAPVWCGATCRIGRRLATAGWAAVVLIGGPGDRAICRTDQGADGGACLSRRSLFSDYVLQPSAAVLSLAAFYVGNNTGMMNLSAAVGVRTYGLFGTYPPFFHASQIVPILSPSGGPDDGMTRMTTEAVLAAIKATAVVSRPAGDHGRRLGSHAAIRRQNNPAVK